MVAIVTQLFPLVNSIGLNEQELAFISKCLGGIHADITGLNGEDEIGKIAFAISFTTEEKMNQKVHSIIYYQSTLRSLARLFQYSKQVYFYFPSITLSLHHFHNI